MLKEYIIEKGSVVFLKSFSYKLKDIIYRENRVDE